MRQIERKIILVTRQTRLQGLRRKFNTAAQAKFYMDRALELDEAKRAPSQSMAALQDRVRERSTFGDVAAEDDVYQSAVKSLRDELLDLMPVHVIDRELLPTFVFGPNDIVVTVGQDGLVANTAKYAVPRPIVGVNPDPARFDGVLLPFKLNEARSAVVRTLEGKAKLKKVTLGEATLADGQKLLAFNDFFIGCRTHISARYLIQHASRSESQSSSGVLVSTGAGSTGWLSSIFNMAAGLGAMVSGAGQWARGLKMAWDDPRLAYVVREPFVSRTSKAGIVAGMITPGQSLQLESQTAQNGVIFSDGVEADNLEFNSGAIVRIGAATEQAMLVV